MDMQTLRDHPKTLMSVAFAIAAAVVVIIAAAFGASGFFNAFSILHPDWIVLAVAGALVAPLGYTMAYKSLSHVADVPALKMSFSARMVAMGFGPFVPAGGFKADRRALEQVEQDEHAAGTHVLAIGTLELALMTPGVCACAAVLVANGTRAPMPSALWPWVVLVPVGFIIGLGLGAWVHRRDPGVDTPGVRGVFVRIGYGVNLLLRLPRELHGWSTIIGMSIYWVADIASFYGAVRFIGLHINLAEVIVAYGTGYLLTRRSMPLGGAGVTEALMTFALHWVGQPIPAALAVVVVYRLFNFVMPALPALWAREQLEPLVESPRPSAEMASHLT